jgi:hypothetical protein
VLECTGNEESAAADQQHLAARLAVLRAAAVLLAAVLRGMRGSELDEALSAAVRRHASSDKEADWWLHMLWRRIHDRQQEAGVEYWLLCTDASEEWKLAPFAEELLEQSPRVFECVPLLAQQLQLLLDQQPQGGYWQGRLDRRQLDHALLLERCNEAAAEAGVQRFELVDVQAAAQVCGLLW